MGLGKTLHNPMTIRVDLGFNDLLESWLEQFESAHNFHLWRKNLDTFHVYFIDHKHVRMFRCQFKTLYLYTIVDWKPIGNYFGKQ